MGEAFVWGLVAGSSLVIGGVVALRVAITRRLLGLIMAFGAGVLISAVAYELVHEAFETSAGDGGIALGLLAGSARLLRSGGTDRPDERRRATELRRRTRGTSRAGTRARDHPRRHPESLVLGLTVLEAGTVSAAFLIAVFLANLPEAIAATTALSRAGRNSTRIIRFWILVAVGFGVTSLAGYVVLDSASHRTVAIVIAFAGGAVLTMLANTMMPEALHYGGTLAAS